MHLYILSSSWGKKAKIVKCHNSVVVLTSLSHVHLLATPWTAARQALLSPLSLEFAQIHLH